jgi:two-component system nitrate/nitrite response regulator NarL
MPQNSGPVPWSWVRRVVVGKWGRLDAEAMVFFCRQAFPDAEVTLGGTGAEILATLYVQPADLLLLDLNLPDMHGADLLHRVAHEKLAIRVLVAAHCRDELSMLVLRDARFDGFLDTEHESAEDLVKALHLVAAGQPYVSPSLRDGIVNRSQVGVIWRQLTPAEFRVLAAIGDGSGNSEVAGPLGLSAATVQTHRRNLMHKLGIVSSAKLVREAIRLGIVRIMPDGRVIKVELQSVIMSKRAAFKATKKGLG